MYNLKHKWNHRNLEIIKLIEENKSILDIGCGDKDFLNFYNASNYFGIDITDKADVQVDLNTDLYPPDQKYDYCLMLGVLEYLKNPNKIINYYKNFADTTVILFSNLEHKKPLWNNFFTAEEKENLVNSNFLSVNKHLVGASIIYICS